MRLSSNFLKENRSQGDIKSSPSDDQFAKVAKAAYLETLVNGNEESKTAFSLVDRFLLLDDDLLSESTRKKKKG